MEGLSFRSHWLRQGGRDGGPNAGRDVRLLSKTPEQATAMRGVSWLSFLLTKRERSLRITKRQPENSGQEPVVIHKFSVILYVFRYLSVNLTAIVSS
jgi:hypothetical protein